MPRHSLSTLVLAAALGVGCAAPLPPSSDAAGSRDAERLASDARGPGSVFASIDAAAIDALSYAYQQARRAGDLERMRAGTIHRVDTGFSYGEIQVASPQEPRRIEYWFAPTDVARFEIYPPHEDREVNRLSEQLSTRDWMSVSVIDPLHRTLYVLHPSLAIRAYSGVDVESIEVASLRGPARAWEWPSLFAWRDSASGAP